MPYAFAGPLSIVDDFKKKLGQFDELVRQYVAALAGHSSLGIRLDKALIAAALAPKSPARTAALADIRARQEELRALRNGGKWGPIIEKARGAVAKGRAALAKLKVPGFGLDPFTLATVAGAIATVTLAVTAMVAFLSRDKRLREDIALTEKKLDAVRSGIPADQIAALDKPKDKGGFLPDLGELVVPALLVTGLLVFGPKLLKGRT